MHESRFLDHFRQVPVFSLADAAQIIDNRAYAKKFLKRMAAEKKIVRIMRDRYTAHNDPFLVAPFLVAPSYITGASALSFHHAITQLPMKVFCATSRRSLDVNFIQEIEYSHTGHFFGFQPEDYMEFRLPVASIEKAIIDSIGIVPLSVVAEAFEEVDSQALVECLQRIGKSSTSKRIGFLAERLLGIDIFSDLKGRLNSRRILLDPLAGKKGKWDSKWKVVVNG